MSVNEVVLVAVRRPRLPGVAGVEAPLLLARLLVGVAAPALRLPAEGAVGDEGETEEVNTVVKRWLEPLTDEVSSMLISSKAASNESSLSDVTE